MNKRLRRTLEETWAKLDALYASLPTVACKKLCGEHCIRIIVTRPEWDRMTDAAGGNGNTNNGGYCPMYDRKTGLCTVHPVRPLICHLWGIVDHDTTRCEHGCEVTPRMLTFEESVEWIRQVHLAAYGTEPPQGNKDDPLILTRYGPTRLPIYPVKGVGIYVYRP